MKKGTLTKRITIRLTEQQRLKLEKIAKKSSGTLTDLIIDAVKAMYHI